MNTIQEFEELKRVSKMQEEETRQRMAQVNENLVGAMERLGFSVKYAGEYDHLYVTLG